ncbi:unnamed protein product [Allacma fusca]|uniref:Carboxylesterase type B domain-containing protein n=1 Tax=Allacma fusca TaxID=39272 RepID=A0A8J2KZQ5_9HEXA|nr:unnamed protein product [Allacma fusca]
MTLFQVSASGEDFSNESKEFSNSEESSEGSDMYQSEGKIPKRSLLGDMKVNDNAKLNWGESEPVLFQSDEFKSYERSYESSEEDETDAGTDDAEGNSEMDGTSFEVNSIQGGNETDRKNSSTKATAKPKSSVPDVDDAPTLSVSLVESNESDVVVSDEVIILETETNDSDASIPVVDIAPALDLIPVESTKPEETPRDKQLLDAQVIPGQENSKDDGIPEAPELEVIPHGKNPEIEKTFGQEISDGMNKLESEVKSLVNPRYASIARNHRVLLTAIIIGFFALAIATVMLTFYRGFKIFSIVIRRHTGGNYRRMEEEVDNDFDHSHAFQQKFNDHCCNIEKYETKIHTMKSSRIPLVIVAVAVLAILADRYLLRSKTETSVIETNAGLLKGFVSLSRDGREFFEFVGIPYAKPPVGELRFEPPLKAEKWEGVLDASKYGNKCPQLDLLFQRPDGDENCLYLNVYTPMLPSVEHKKPLPVMVFFHGGIYFFGSGSAYRGDFIMDEDVILVTVNYRLASFGFLNTGDGIVAGNMGLKDQNMALRWVQENIQYFGGNPNGVTIFGQSAGAASVHFHVISPMSKGLFQRAISQSGAALNPWTIWSEPAAQAKRFAQKFNCNTENTKEMVACMKKLTMQEIMTAHQEVLVTFRDMITVFVPTVESGKVGPNTFLPAHPREMLKANKFNKVPWLAGANGQDGLLFSAALVRNDSVRDIVFNDFESIAHKVLYVKPNSNASKIKDLYMSTPPNLNDLEAFNKLTNMFTDRCFSNGIREAATLQSAHAPVYLYDYNYKGKFRPGNMLIAIKRQYPVVLEFLAYMAKKIFNEYILGHDAPFYGVGHIDELALLFHIPWLTNVKAGHKDYEMSKAMVKLWTSFAQNRKSLDFLGVTLNPVEPKDSSIKYLNINSTPSILDDPFRESYSNFSIAIFLPKVYFRAEETEVIVTAAGQLKGSVSKSRQGRTFFEFVGIPFAKPPVGELRFEPPQKADKWEGILEATKYGPMCPQLSHILYLPDGNEDCLFLNVYTPWLPVLSFEVEKKESLPVMVFFHGGAFVFGDGFVYRPDYFMDEDVILVVIQYRLNSLGFLNTGDGIVAGNMGLKDQNMALRWVQENIQSFGGNPKEVTIFGQSAGAASVHLHVLSPMSKGLFQRAISQSGTALSPWVIRIEPAFPSRRFAEKLNCSTRNTQEMIACMKNLTMEEILTAHREITVPYRDVDTVFVPTVDSGKIGPNTFLPAHPREILKSHNFNKVPWLVGANGQDGLVILSDLIKNDSLRDGVFNNFETMAQNVLYVKPNKNASKIKNLYMPTPPSLNDLEAFNKLTNLFTDRYFSNGIREAATLQSAHAPVYLYDYNYKGEFRLFNLLIAMKRKYPVILEIIGHIIKKIFKEILLGYDPPFYGVGHCDELAMLFHMKWMVHVNQNHRDFEMSKSVVKLWTSFAQNRTTLEFRGVAFKPLDPKDSSVKYLNINSTPSILDDPFVERYKFWESLNASPNL